MDDVPSNEDMDNEQPYVASTVKRGFEQVTAQKLTSNSTDTSSEIMGDMKLQSAEKYNERITMMSYFKCSTNYSPTQNVDRSSR